MIQNLTIRQLVTDYFQVHHDEIPGANEVNPYDENKIISVTSLAWLTDNCGKLYQEVTKDENLNADLIDIFAQTFVRHFWSMPIGYDSPVTFFVHLRAFLDENLPVWAEFYKEAIIKHGLYTTTAGTVTVEDNGTVHFEGTNSTDSKATNTGKSSSDEINNTKSTTTNNTTQNSNSQTLSADADSPQDQLNLSINQDSASGGYDFKYASKVSASLNKNNTTTNGNSTTTNTGTISTTGNNSSNQTGHSLGQNSHDQQTGSFNQQKLKQRTQALSELALSVSRLADGIYLNIFTKMKHYGLFLLTY